MHDHVPQVRASKQVLWMSGRSGEQARHPSAATPSKSPRSQQPRVKLRGAYHLATRTAVTLLAAGLASCGGSAQSPAAVRVDGATITRATVKHWTNVIEKSPPDGSIGEEPHGAHPCSTPRQRALDFLISSRWLIDQAAAQGLAASDRAGVERVLTERKEANGAGEFQESLKATGRTVADIQLEIEAELAAAAIRRTLASRAAHITQPEITAYYDNNQQHFLIPEQRIVDLVEDLPTRAAAAAVARRMRAGATYTGIANHETLEETSDIKEEIPVLHTIFKAHLGAISPPTPLKHLWGIFVVRKIIPAKITPLADATKTITNQLTTSHLQQLTSEFTSQYEKRWTSKTSCQPGYIIQKCSQYTGPKQTKPNPFPTNTNL